MGVCSDSARGDTRLGSKFGEGGDVSMYLIVFLWQGPDKWACDNSDLQPKVVVSVLDHHR